MDWSWLGVLTVSDQSAPAIPIAEECKCYFTMWGSSDLMLIQTLYNNQRQRKRKTQPFYLIFHDNNCLLSLKFDWIILVSFWSHNHRDKSYQCEIFQQQQYVWVRVWLSALFINHSLHSKLTAEIFLIPEPFLCLVDHCCKEISFKSIISFEWIPAIFWGFLRGTHFPLYISLHKSTIGSPILVKSALAKTSSGMKPNVFRVSMNLGAQ